MISLEEIISNILTTQHKDVSNYLVKASKGFNEIGLAEEDIPSVSFSFGFYHEDKLYNLQIVLEKEFD